MPRPKKIKIPFTADSLVWTQNFSRCKQYVVWQTELTKDFKKIWYANRDYFIHCGFSCDYEIITFHGSFQQRDSLIATVL